MSGPPRPQDLLLQLRAAGDDAPDVANVLLRHLCALLEVDQDPGQVAGGSVHLRGEAYDAVFVHRASHSHPETVYAPSATLWRWVEATGAPVTLDVAVGRVGDAAGAMLGAAGWREGSATQASLVERGTTHACAIPLLDLRGRLRGMVSIEWCCPRSAGRPFDVWTRSGAALVLAVDLASPFLLAASHRRPPEMADEPGIPVVGAETARLLRLLERFAATDEPVLLLGETGTGKTHLARWCHGRSARRGGPFVPVHLHATPEALREGSLFGWRKGAFTGAHRDHAGFVAAAHGGTLFLDDVDKVPLESQTRLLRLVDERRYTALGDVLERSADVRIVAATSADLSEAVRDGRFLEDLYYRLAVLPVRVPPLRERLDEVERWATWLLRQAGVPAVASLTPDAVAVLRGQAWPGNLRELRNVVTRAAAGADHEGGQVVVDAVHVLGALGADRPARRPAWAAIHAAAVAFVEEAESRRTRGEGVPDLEAAGAFRALVLEVATTSLGGERAAFELFGLDHLFRGGNHLRMLRRDRERLQVLREALRAR